MKLSETLLAAALAASVLSAGEAFVGIPPVTRFGVQRTASPITALSMAANTVYEGKPTERALNLDIRNEIRKSSFFDVEGNSVTMDDLLGEPFQSGVSVVVFLRSLG